MVTRTPTSWAVFFLRLLSILPSRKSNLKDKIGLIFWTCLTIGLTFCHVYQNLDAALGLLSLHSVYTLFAVLQKFIVPACQIIATIPTLYHLISYYPHIVEDNLLSALKNPWIFSVSVALSIISCFIQCKGVVGLCGIDPLLCVTILTLITVFYSIQILTFFMIGICMDQMRQKIENGSCGFVDISKKLAPEILKDYSMLKAGIAPLLFLVFSCSSLNIIAFSATMMIGKNWNYGILAAFFFCVLFYITLAIDKTFESLQAFLLELR